MWAMAATTVAYRDQGGPVLTERKRPTRGAGSTQRRHDSGFNLNASARCGFRARNWRLAAQRRSGKIVEQRPFRRHAFPAVVIADAEAQLQVPIAGAYKRFLSDFGWGGARGLEIFGLGDSVPTHLDLIALTTSERLEMHPHLPSHLLPLANSGTGDLFCLDTRIEHEPPEPPRDSRMPDGLRA